MNETVNIAIVARSIVTFLFIAVGLAALIYGSRLFKSGVGLRTDGTTVDLGNIKIAVGSVGAVMALTSIAWGYFG